ncbi:MAG: phosphoglycerate dehydrogenase [Candidatus Ruminococcus intestinipullorum]|nr:phosphoglycerate dehydrogenase [Candidatus Ruminococcus intestinipullorum]
MYRYHCLNPISQVGIEKFTEKYQAVEDVCQADAILVRSASMHKMEFDNQLKVIARAGAGVNNIPLDRCAEQGIVVFNTPGANANGVKELVLAGMLMAARDIVGGIQWVQSYDAEEDVAKATEKKKKAFAGTELEGKKLGVIGLGAIGVLVANAAANLGMEVYGFDPYVSVDAAWKLSRNIHHAQSAEEIYKVCDYITIHVPALQDTIGMINKDTLALMKEDVVILNFARDILVNQEDILEALDNRKIRCYVTDFPTKELQGKKGTIVIPHLGASTEESEDNCAKMAVAEIMDYLENGNIKHSVNYPDCDMGVKGTGNRITILHRNIPNMLGQFTGLLALEGMNISLLANKSKGEYAYTMIDVEAQVSDAVQEQISKVEGVLKVRVIS